MFDFAKPKQAPSAAPAQRLPDPSPDSFKRSDPTPVLSTAASPQDFYWTTEFPAAATSAQTFYLVLTNGMVYSTMGLSPSVQLTCRVYQDGKKKAGQTFSHSGTSLKISADKLSASCEQMSITHNPATSGYTMKFALDAGTLFDVEFVPVDGVFKVNEGKVLFSDTEGNGFVQARFMPKAAVTGSMVLDGKKSDVLGQGLFHFATQCKPQCPARWNFVNLQTEKDALMLYEFEMSQKGGYNVSISSVGAVVRNGKTIAVTTDNRAIHVQAREDDFSHYEIPTQVYLTWNGKTNEDKNIRVVISRVLENSLDKIDLLAELPFLLRKFIQTFITAPFVYSWYEDVVATVEIQGEAAFDIAGKMFFESTFLARE